MYRTPRIVVWIFGSIGVVGVVAFLFAHTELKGMLGELFEPTYQFFLLVLIGGGISFAYGQYAKEEEQRQREKEKKQQAKELEKRLLMNTYNELVTAYNHAKRVRRLLRARCLPVAAANLSSEHDCILASEYDHQMEELLDAQLEFESIQRRIGGNEDLFGRYPELQREITIIRRYLHDPLDEYEDLRRSFEGDPPQKKLDELPILSAFLGQAGPASEYWKEFKRPFRASLRCLRHAIEERPGPSEVETLEDRPLE